MVSHNKSGRFEFSPLVISMDIVGFALILVGGALIRFSNNETVSILGGFVLAGGVTVLSLSRLVSK